MDYIKYKAGYKYQLAKDYSTSVSIKPPKDINIKYISLNTLGILSIRSGYAWDGPSGPTIDTKNFMRGSLVHDALYQLIQIEVLAMYYRRQADVKLYKICIEDGMFKIRAKFIYAGVRAFGGVSIILHSNKTITAP